MAAPGNLPDSPPQQLSLCRVPQCPLRSSCGVCHQCEAGRGGGGRFGSCPSTRTSLLMAAPGPWAGGGTHSGAPGLLWVVNTTAVTVLLTGPHTESPPPRQDAQAGLADLEPRTVGPPLVSILGQCPRSWEVLFRSGNGVPPAVTQCQRSGPRALPAPTSLIESALAGQQVLGPGARLEGSLRGGGAAFGGREPLLAWPLCAS